jgi:zinc and cadmium transporter
LAYALSFQIDVSWLIPFAAGNFLYIGASDLIPEVNKHSDLGVNLVNLLMFALGLALVLTAKVAFEMI